MSGFKKRKGAYESIESARAETAPLDDKETLPLEYDGSGSGSFTLKQVILVMGLVAMGAGGIGYWMAVKQTAKLDLSSSSSVEVPMPSCGSVLEELTPTPPVLSLPSPSSDRHWIFAELSAAEVRAVAAAAVEALPECEGGVYTEMSSSAYDEEACYITGTSAVELIPPIKSEARAFLTGDSDDAPSRYAKVTVARGGSRGDVMEYKMGPIRSVDGTFENVEVDTDDVVAMTEPGAVPWAKRPYDMGESFFVPLVKGTLEALGPILLERFGPVFDGPSHDKSVGSILPFAFNDILSSSTDRISKFAFFWYKEDGYFDALWLHPLPFVFHVNQKNGGSADDWEAYDFKLCEKGPYATVEALTEAYRSDPEDFDCTLPANVETDGVRGAFDTPGAPYGATGRATPAGAMPARMVSAPSSEGRWVSSDGGKKGAVGRYVEWQGWTFYTTVRPSTGLAALDVTFKGHRIAHEVALAEAMAAYSGSVSDGDQVFYLDAAYSMSQLGGSKLVKGVDCPADAEYPENIATFHVIPSGVKGGNPVDSDVSKAIGAQTVCIFEEDLGDSLWRHSTLNKNNDGVRNSNLVVRHVTTVGNYDYITEYRFGLDGSFRIKFNFAGYCETRWYQPGVNPEERMLSEVVGHNLVAPLHAHFGLFKLDLDVLGEDNTFEIIEAKVGTFDDVEGTKNIYPTKYLETTHIEKEEFGKSTRTVNPMKPTTWRIVNRDPALSGYGNPHSVSRAPGYAILPGATVVNTLPPDHPFVLAAAFSKYNLVVTKRHESEYRATSVYDLYGPGEPIASIDDFVKDGESLEDVDLVAWVTLGKEHVTRTEDLPLISSAFGVEATLLPWNIFNGHAGMDVPTEPTPKGCSMDV